MISVATLDAPEPTSGHDVLSYRSPRAHAEATQFIGMAIFLGPCGMRFAALFFGYGAVRLRANVWPPVGEVQLPVWPAFVNTFVIACASACFELALRSAKLGQRGRVLGWLVGVATFAA